jgi:hypothetical protein
MPNRWLKEGYITSERIMSVSTESRDCWLRLVLVADDHGLFEARPQIVASRCYPLEPSARKCQQMLAELERADLIRRYEVEGKPYLLICRWYERSRSKPKYPLPPATVVNCEQPADGCMQLPAIVDPHVHVHDHVHDHGARKGRGQSAVAPLPDGWEPKQQTVEKLSREFGLRVPEDVDRYVAAFRDACAAKAYKYADFEAAFRNCVRQDWPKFRANGQLRGQQSIV